MLERQLRLQHAAQWGTGDSPIGRPTIFDGLSLFISDLFNGFYRKSKMGFGYGTVLDQTDFAVQTQEDAASQLAEFCLASVLEPVFQKGLGVPEPC